MSKKIIAKNIKLKAEELNQLIDKANDLNLSIYLIQAQKTINGVTLYSNIGLKIYETKEY